MSRWVQTIFRVLPHEPVSDIDTVVVDSLKALDPEWPMRSGGRFAI